MERCLLYVSRRALASFDSRSEVDEIVTTARSRNKVLNVTGGLICTANYFAQLLEGSSSAIDELMQSIDADRRHNEVTVLIEEAVLNRRLPDWAMAYSGGSVYISRQVEGLLGGLQSGNGARAERLRSLIVGLATADGS